MKSYLEEIAPRPDAPTTPMSQGADFGIRLLARFIDLLFTFLFGLVAGICGGMTVGILSALGRIEGEIDTIVAGLEISNGTMIIAAFAYHVVAEGIGGASFGKLICGLRVVQTNGHSCAFLGALKRGLLYHFDGLFFGLVGYNSMKDGPLRQRYGDHWAKTVVVKHAIFQATPQVSVWRIVAGLAVALATWFAIVFADMFHGVLF